MNPSLSFSEEIEGLEAALDAHEEELAELEEKRRAFDIQTRETRDALSRLRQTMRGELPDRKGRRRQTSELEPLDINPESGRPSRGARRVQIETLCRQLARSGATFQTKDVIEELTRIEGELSTGIRSYIYAVMNSLQDEKTITKVGRGRWQLN
ncbi:MAG: hypothetical protein ACNA8W_25190, partial [Bradymonadaceae bacterium]